jgi:hypothetical protein
LTLSSVTESLSAPGTLYYPRLNQLDLKFSKAIKYRTTKIEPQIGFFNALNAPAILTQNNTFGSSLNQVQQVLDGRVVRVGMQIDF